MNEEELKEIWQLDQTAPDIDFSKLQVLLDDWQNRLRRKVKADLWAQSIASVVAIILVILYPAALLALIILAVIGAWYFWELGRLYKQESMQAEDLSVKQSLNLRILNLKRFFRRTRIAMYVFSPLIIPALFYGMMRANLISTNFSDWYYLLVKAVIVFEIVMVVMGEAYARILYFPSLRELETLFKELDD